MELKNLSASYKKQLVYDNLNLTFDEIGITFLKGDSGSGKSTLLNILYGIKAYEGEYIIPDDITKFRRNNMSYIFQDYKVQPELTVLENIVLHLNIKDIEVDYDYIDQLLDLCYIKHNKHKKAKFLSGGEKQRLAIVRALVSKPSILLCDEPTGNLDEETSFEIFDILKEISKTKLVIVASHSKILIEKYADRVYQVENKGLTELKNNHTKKLNYDTNEYGVMNSTNMFKLAKRNYILNFMRINFLFVVFAIFAALFLVLNFSKSSFDDFLDDKYENFQGKHAFVVDIIGYSSLEELDEFIEKYGYDNYLIDTVYNQNYLSGMNLGINYYRRSNSYTYSSKRGFRIYPDFKLKHLDDTYTKQLPFHTLGSADMFAVNDFPFIEKYLVTGRMPRNKYEMLINENALKSIINEYNQLIIESDAKKDLLDLDNMSSEEIVEFLSSNNLGVGYEDSFYYDKDALFSYNYPIVGVIDDKNFRFDNYPFNLDQKHSGTHRKHNRNIYVSTTFLLNQFKLSTFNYKGNRGEAYYDYSKVNNNTAIDPFLILEEEVDVYSKELFKTVMLFDEDVNINTYLDRIKLLSDSDRIEDVKFTEFYYEISEDFNNQKNITKYIRNYSIYILTIGFLTAFIAFVRFCIKRKDEFLIYELLGMEEKEKKSLFKKELLLITVNVSLLVTMFYFIFTKLLANVIATTISGLIYKTRDFNVSYSFSPIPVLILVSLLIPFIFCYKIYKRKLV